jgi:transposase
MPKKYIVQLKSEERQQLLELTQKGQAAAPTITHARILLRADCAEERPGWTDETIAEALDTSVATVERVRKVYVQQGLKLALERKERVRHRSRRLNGTQEAHLIALACSEPPTGHARWTMRLLAGKMIELERLDTLSPDTVHRTLKKMNSSRG